MSRTSSGKYNLLFTEPFLQLLPLFSFWLALILKGHFCQLITMNSNCFRTKKGLIKCNFLILHYLVNSELRLNDIALPGNSCCCYRLISCYHDNLHTCSLTFCNREWDTVSRRIIQRNDTCKSLFKQREIWGLNIINSIRVCLIINIFV